ncbi:MAG: DUF2240 family protein [Methanomassiliicoccaceae archaeon]|nr:DUF2240 family protein [Methanomassiliicoccaceae archaeon]
MDPLELTAAAFFRTKGKNVVTENEFFMGVSMDLRWMGPGDTKELISRLVSGGILEKDGEYLRPTFDVRTADVPIGFKPTADMLGIKQKSAPPAPPADGLLSELMAEAESIGIKRKDFIVSVNAIQKRMNVDIEIAALLLLRDNGVDVTGRCGNAYDVVAKR